MNVRLWGDGEVRGDGKVLLAEIQEVPTMSVNWKDDATLYLNLSSLPVIVGARIELLPTDAERYILGWPPA